MRSLIVKPDFLRRSLMRRTISRPVPSRTSSVSFRRGSGGSPFQSQLFYSLHLQSMCNMLRRTLRLKMNQHFAQHLANGNSHLLDVEVRVKRYAPFPSAQAHLRIPRTTLDLLVKEKQQATHRGERIELAADCFVNVFRKNGEWCHDFWCSRSTCRSVVSAARASSDSVLNRSRDRRRYHVDRSSINNY